MCDFDSQAEGDDWEGWSRWCGIFTRDEWEVLGHWRDTQRYFWVGEGSVSCVRFFKQAGADIEQRYGSTMGVSYTPIIPLGVSADM
jgi:hypothetical protein